MNSQWCSFNINMPPSTDYNACTHLEDYRYNVGMIMGCKSHKSEETCLMQNGCKWNKDPNDEIKVEP